MYRIVPCFLAMSLGACSETIEQVKSLGSEKHSSSDAMPNEKEIFLMSLSFTEEKDLKAGLVGEHLQEGQLRTQFFKGGDVELCGAILNSRRVKGAVRSDDLPPGMVRNHKINQSKTTLAWYGYKGTWRSEGNWNTGVIDQRSKKGRCDGEYESFPGGAFGCIRLSDAPYEDMTVCGFEMLPIRANWQRNISRASLGDKIEIPQSIGDKTLHWILIGNATGIHWNWKGPEKSGQERFVSKAVAFNLTQFGERVK